MELNGHVPQFPCLSHSRVQEMKGCWEIMENNPLRSSGQPQSQQTPCSTHSSGCLGPLGWHSSPPASLDA